MLQGFVETFVILAAVVIFPVTSDNGTGFLETATTPTNDCYERYGNVVLPGASLEDMTTINELRYYNIFIRTPAHEQSSFFVPGELYNCWDTQYQTEFEKITSKIGATSMFASFHPPHSKALGELADVFIENMRGDDPSHGKTVTFLEYVRQRGDIHPQLFVSAVPIALVSTRSDLIGTPTPSFVEMFPSRFIPNIVPIQGPDQGNNTCIKVNERWGSTKTNGIENRLWYFREDIQLNSHHWNWHHFHSTQASPQIPRRGELFYFFHHDLMARYGAERLANGFRDYFVEGVKPIVGFVLKQGYDANLRDGISSKNWINRVNNTKLRKNSLPRDQYDILKVHAKWWNHVKAVTEKGQVFDGNNKTIPLFPKPDGINTIGELFEGSRWSINKYFYGSIGWHNAAHDLLGSVLIEKNQEERKEWGVLSDVSTAVRDIYFYRIHTEVNDMFMRYKHTILKPYEINKGEHPFIVPGIVAKSIQVQTIGNGTLNNLTTFWNNHNIVVNGGLDIPTTEAIRLDVCVKHLDHKDFTYNIKLENQAGTDRQVFVRIFMAPRYNLDRVRFNLTEQFKLFFAMDSFPATLGPGLNKISRSSLDCTVTEPWFQQPSQGGEIPTGKTCSCGWPHHLLLPKGSHGNVGVYDLVVLVTDGSDYSGKPSDICASSYVHCSKLNGDMEYPDKKPMGWPFDRRPFDELRNVYLSKLLRRVPNMASTKVTIVHDDQNPKEHVI